MHEKRVTRTKYLSIRHDVDSSKKRTFAAKSQFFPRFSPNHTMSFQMLLSTVQAKKSFGRKRFRLQVALMPMLQLNFVKFAEELEISLPKGRDQGRVG